ncbi:zinc finger BED domain-containing protein 4-like [Centruroides sculpturatus]|uniref:zinc finger BED domain-containing protein 4-like n=1 Tax=Centruroides sculpturatus TaxID=218467 RepID=UPI000C6EC4B5|nr:zinc finger BED domain-containing protein 4-like [Centruroides sculpturatus]
MLERLDCIKDSLSLYSTNNKIEQFDAEEWILIQELVSSEACGGYHKKLSAQNICISDVIPLVRALNKLYDGIQISANSGETLNISTPAVLDFLSSLKNELDYRFSEIDKNMLFQIATFLDPRYKALETEVNITTTTTITEKPNAVRKEYCNNLEDSIANMLDSDDEDEKSENQISYTNANLLTEYATEKRLSRDQDPLMYWEINSKKFGGLSHMARTYLSSPATSVPSEQFFSAAGIIYDPHHICGYGYGYPAHH